MNTVPLLTSDRPLVPLTDVQSRSGIFLEFSGRPEDPDPGILAFRADRSVAAQVWFHEPTGQGGALRLKDLPGKRMIEIVPDLLSSDIICLMICLNRFDRRSADGVVWDIPVMEGSGTRISRIAGRRMPDAGGLVVAALVRTRIAWTLALLDREMGGRTVRDMTGAIHLL